MPKTALDRKVPDFTLPATGTEERWSLKQAAGRKLVIFFYPKDMTSGCTLEAQGFRDHAAAFRKAGTTIVGISRDSLASHEKFCAKEKLPYLLLSDEDEKVCRLFDVIQEKSLYGRKYMGIERSTFLIGKDGKIKKIFRKVKPEGHAEEVYEALRSGAAASAVS